MHFDGFGERSEMGECFACGQDMNTADGCDPERTIEIDGETFDPLPYGESDYWDSTDTEPQGRCHDCGARVGNIHHPGCDMERCPNCGGQYFICECDTDEKRTIWGGS